MSDQDVNESDSNELLTDNQMNFKNRNTIHRIIDKLFKLYSDSDEFKDGLKSKIGGNKVRSLLLTIVKEPLQGIDINTIAYSAYNSIDAVRFGSRLNNNRLERWMPDDLTLFTVHCLLDQDIFIDLLIGKDRHGNDFDINDAWGRKWIGFEGEDWIIHKEILADMFNKFRHLLNIKKLLR